MKKSLLPSPWQVYCPAVNYSNNFKALSNSLQPYQQAQKIELPAAQAQSLDAQFERIKKGNEEVTFNGEKFYKQTKVFDKSEDPRFFKWCGKCRS